MTLSKETLEATTPASKAASPTAAQPKPDLNRLRADAVSLDVPVKVHGSRVTEVVRGVTPHTEPFEEESSTMIVFPHGGVVRMATAVTFFSHRAKHSLAIATAASRPSADTVWV